MKNLKRRFDEDPIFALGVLATFAVIGTGVLKATAKIIESSAYAYRASKLQ